MTSVAPRWAVSKLSCQCTLGQCLREALEDAKNADASDSEETVKIDMESVSRIMDAFGGAAASTVFDSTKQLTPKTPTLMKARVEYYNRIGEHWRIVTDSVKIKRRRLQTRKRTSRSSRESLWDSSSGVVEEILNDNKMQILAYNDS